jgi:hypothetical protein
MKVKWLIVLLLSQVCCAESKQLARSTAVQVEHCAMPVIAKLLSCYMARDKGCILVAASQLVACMSLLQQMPTTPTIDVSMAEPESSKSYSPPSNSDYVATGSAKTTPCTGEPLLLRRLTAVWLH